MCLPEGAMIWPDSLVDDLMIDFKQNHPEVFASLSNEDWWAMRSRWINRAGKYNSHQRIQILAET